MFTSEHISDVLMKFSVLVSGVALGAEVGDKQLGWFDQYITFMNANASAVAATVAILSLILQGVVNIYRIRYRARLTDKE